MSLSLSMPKEDDCYVIKVKSLEHLCDSDLSEQEVDYIKVCSAGQ